MERLECAAVALAVRLLIGDLAIPLQPEPLQVAEYAEESLDDLGIVLESLGLQRVTQS